jgi:Holliday junction resolvase
VVSSYRNRKAKGSQAERELVKKFWSINWACIRSAGSGSQHYPSPDILVGNGSRRLAIEVKTISADKKYFAPEEIRGLSYFSAKFGAEPWVAVKFQGMEWVFLTLEDLEDTGKSKAVSKELAGRRGLSFEDLTET